ncbi:hypothetical protein F8388_001429 [Cannabis sativa]|uniref:Glycolipid transfer protein domain-containing protein n=1 Tax=Cannabis sativa TaxID=3483 RepID=A0A7J6ENF1_CANSA|nr:hypothetical protein G4B88_000868 [Cannabis sativa]KAF4384191.1 hypothetical protein F8388_001429 [Cannabis sativa]
MMKREMEAMMSLEKKSEIRSAIEELSMSLANLRTSTTTTHDDDDDHHVEDKIPFHLFISLCNLLLLLLDKIGPTMAVLRQDIHQNIQRLEMVHETDSSTYSNLVEILKKEVAQGNAKKPNSCTRALLWLTRSLDFSVELLQKYSIFCDENMNQIVEDAYNITLKPWHGWISSTAVKVALKLVPGHKTFLKAVMEINDENPEDSLRVTQELDTFVSLLKPLLQHIHSTLRAHGVDRLKST